MRDFNDKTPPPDCDHDIYRRGVSVLVLPSLSMHRCEHWISLVRAQCNEPIDWHYAGGRNNILTTGSVEKVRAAMRSQWLALWELFKDQHEEEHYTQETVQRWFEPPPPPPPEEPWEEKWANFAQGTAYLVEATSCEQQFLWERWNKEIEWKSSGRGMFDTVGHLAGRPICVTFFFAHLNGRKVMFWEATSQLVDHAMIEAWLKERFPRVPHTDALNFHHAVPRKGGAP